MNRNLVRWIRSFAALLTLLMLATVASACGASGPDPAQAADENTARKAAASALVALSKRDFDTQGCAVPETRVVPEAEARAGTAQSEVCTLLVARMSDQKWLVVVRSKLSSKSYGAQARVTVNPDGAGVGAIRVRALNPGSCCAPTPTSRPEYFKWGGQRARSAVGLVRPRRAILSLPEPTACGKPTSSHGTEVSMDGERKRQSLFSGPSEMHARISALDWARTPLGAVDGWPQSLKAVVRTLLSSRYPMVLTWGPQLTQIYNDAYARIIADKHPAALGIDIRVTLAEAWDTLGPMIEQVMQTGVANWTPALRLLLERSGYREEAYFSVSHAPSEDDAGRIVGMLAVCSEVTQQVLGERRMRLLRDLASKAGETRSVRPPAARLAAAIGEHPLECRSRCSTCAIPESGALTLGAAVGLPEDGPASPARVELGRERKGASAGEGEGEAMGDEAAGDEWPLARALAGETVLVEDVERRLSMRGGAFDDPVRSALVMPIASPAARRRSACSSPA